MLPWVQAATICGGCMFRRLTSRGSTPQSFSRPISRWKCAVETNGTATFLPTRSSGLSIPEPSRATSCSDLPMLSRIQKSSRSTPRVAAAVMPVEPSTPTGTSPEASAVEMSPAELNWRQSAV